MLEQAISARAREIEPGREARAAALFALRAVEAFSAGAHLEARVTLCGLRSALRQIGGSDAQHELFSRMFAEAGRRLRAQTTTSAEWRVAA